MLNNIISPGATFRPRITLFIMMMVLSLNILPGYGEDGIVLNQFQILPKLSVSETYSDNIFRSEKNQEAEYITHLSPELRINYAIENDNMISLGYEGEFRTLSQYNHLNTAHHKGDLNWRMETPKGSALKIGTSLQESAIQPFSKQETEKEFMKWDGYGSASISAFSSTEFGTSYRYTTRRFEADEFNEDDYNRNHLSLYLVYKRLPMTPILFEYNYIHQDNNDVENRSKDLVNHKFYAGARWDATTKVTGVLKLGYMYTDFRVLEDFSGFSMDSDLIYRFSDITKLTLTAHRTVTPTTRADRETEDYFMDTGTSLSIEHHKWDPIVSEVEFAFVNKSFQENQSLRDGREDQLLDMGAKVRYHFNPQSSIGLKYQHRENDSNREGHDYTENRIQLGITLSI